MTELLPDSDALDFLLEIAASRNEFDLARIEALRGIEIADGLTNRQRSECCKLLTSILGANGEDPDVSNYAAMASAYFMDNDSVYETLLSVLVDESRDSNLRWNAFAAVERFQRQPKSIDALRSLTSDTEFQGSAKRLLSEWESI